jgi:transcriptional regulator with XRE-family HTH domain
MGIRLKVREYAERAGVNQAQLARRADMGTNTVYELWRNIRAENVRIGTIVRVASVLGVSWCDLVEVTEDSEAVIVEDGPRQTMSPWMTPALPR